MKHVTIDPVTRIEGHLRVEMTVDEGSGKVTDALSSGTAWRGLELIMNGRDPEKLYDLFEDKEIGTVFKAIN